MAVKKAGVIIVPQLQDKCEKLLVVREDDRNLLVLGGHPCFENISEET